MSELQFRTECKMAREHLRQAMRNYLQAPTELNVHRVEAAKKRWYSVRSGRSAFAKRRVVAMPQRLRESSPE